MDQCLIAAFDQGYERMAAWSDLLDAINLYPVADSDTGRNLRISLAPLKNLKTGDVPGHLLMSAIGNSGNIAGAFFAEFSRIEIMTELLESAGAGRDAAWRALQDPKRGTMLSVFDALVEVLLEKSLKSKDKSIFQIDPEAVITGMRYSVLSTSDELAELRNAGVVDSGALGMFLFFEGFFRSLFNQLHLLCNPYELYGDKLKIPSTIEVSSHPAFCIDTVIVPSLGLDEALQRLSGMGEHVVTVSDGRHLKVHLHAHDEESARKDLADVGNLMRWQSEKIDSRPAQWSAIKADTETVHIVTDAAGSLSMEVARELGITLLDSYVMIDQRLLPESTVSAKTLYGAMSRGVKVTTCQASVFERHQRYECLAQRFANIVYLCVGSAYTGNYETAKRWAESNRNGHRMALVDTGAASGRLGLVARRAAKFANSGNSLTRVVEYAGNLCLKCDELIFLDQLKFLAAGGRISKASGFVGDLLNIKPVIRPGRKGAQKVGVVKNHNAQVEFLLDYIGKKLNGQSPSEILLQFTDNYDRVVSHIQPQIRKHLPGSPISVQPMSATSGVHMGPGTWAAAFLSYDSCK